MRLRVRLARRWGELRPGSAWLWVQMRRYRMRQLKALRTGRRVWEL